jgi:putative ABC transport system substrate-binding protein
MNRREVLAALGGVPIFCAHPAIAQSPDRARRVGVVNLGVESTAQRSLLKTFVGRLEQLGWVLDRSLQVDVRWAGDDAARTAAELVRSGPDVVVAQGIEGLRAVLQETRTIPTVFVQITDPAAAGFVTSLTRPGGNTTGVANFPASISGDRVQVLKEIDPRLARILLVHDRNYATPPALLRAAEAAATSLGLGLSASGAGDADELENQIHEFARERNGGLVVFPSPFTVAQSQRIIGLAAQLNLPAIYPLPNFAVAGGLISYGVNTPALWQEAATYVDRILRGANPADLPVHVPTSVDIVANLKTARAMGLTIPPALLARGAKMIE